MLHQLTPEPQLSCENRPSIACRTAWNVTHDQKVTGFFHTWLDQPLTTVTAIIITVILALVVRRVTHRTIGKITVRMSEGTMSDRIREKTRTIFDGSPALVSARRKQRAETMDSLLRSIASVLILGVAAFTIVGELGLNLAPVLASASIIGVAVAFGAQNLVKDFLSGIFMLLEDQYGVGDIVDVGEAKGTVEAVTLRVTRLRDVNGVVWYMRNGEIKRVGNESQNWARAVLDIPVSYDENVDHVKEILKTTADAFAADPLWEEKIIEEPSVWGVQALLGEAVVVRLVLKTAPGKQGEVARELRARVKDAFDKAGVSIAPLNGS
ncbi:MAG: MscS Mechanosensitive ion channel [Actinomycetia bacterium]|nr:MscS Mechanosensitive ion channel [Actinomycetes bacterium]